MTSTTKHASQTVARPSARNARSSSKVVLDVTGELNRHVPMDDWAKPEPKPWKQASRSYPRFRVGKVVTRRNAGRDDGRTWMSGRYVCGAGLEEDWSDEGGEGRDLEEDERRGDVFMEGEERRDEVAIMEIAKPMRLRGPTREYEVVDTIPRVIALEEDEDWEWVAEVGLEREDDHWETIGETISSRDSYAQVLQRQVA